MFKNERKKEKNNLSQERALKTFHSLKSRVFKAKFFFKCELNEAFIPL